MSESNTSQIRRKETGEIQDILNKASKSSLPILSVVISLVTWVVSAEFLQGVTTGSFCPERIPFNKPIFLTWFDCNFLSLCLLLVYPYVRFHRRWTFLFFVENVWAGEMGVKKVMLACVGMSYTSIVLYVLYAIGLRYISTALTVSLYQLQAGFTVGFAVCLLGDRFLPIQLFGILASFVGVGLLVLPPLLISTNNRGDRSTYFSESLIGALSIIISGIIWAVYQVSWRYLLESKYPPPAELPRLEGLMDTCMTMGAIGICNFFLGWPLLVVAHLTKIETFEMPLSSHWPILLANAFAQYSFDASFPISVYLTSPIVTAITTPLTIPLGLLADQLIYGAHIKVGIWGWVGVLLILLGVMAIETNFDVPVWKKQAKETADKSLAETEMQPYVSFGVD